MATTYVEILWKICVAHAGCTHPYICHLRS